MAYRGSCACRYSRCRKQQLALLGLHVSAGHSRVLIWKGSGRLGWLRAWPARAHRPPCACVLRPGVRASGWGDRPGLVDAAIALLLPGWCCIRRSIGLNIPALSSAAVERCRCVGTPVPGEEGCGSPERATEVLLGVVATRLWHVLLCAAGLSRCSLLPASQVGVQEAHEKRNAITVIDKPA